MTEDEIHAAFPEEICIRNLEGDPYVYMTKEGAEHSAKMAKDDREKMVAVYRRVEIYQVKSTVVLERIPVIPAKKPDEDSLVTEIKIWENLPRGIWENLPRGITDAASKPDVVKIERLIPRGKEGSVTYRLWYHNGQYQHWFPGPNKWEFTWEGVASKDEEVPHKTALWDDTVEWQVIPWETLPDGIKDQTDRDLDRITQAQRKVTKTLADPTIYRVWYGKKQYQTWSLGPSGWCAVWTSLI